MKSKLGDKQRVQHILQAIREIENYTAGLPSDAFFNNSLIKSASVFQLEIIGEAASRVTNETKERYKEIDWRGMISVRNIIAHVYWGIDFVQVWEIIKKNYQC